MSKLAIPIIALAAVLRLYSLSTVPPSLSLDEVSLGYNAYSILKTNRDEYGTRWPILLRAYDDWRPALYVYLVVPFVAILGLTPAAVRLPSALLGILTVLLTYLLTKELLSEKKRSSFVSGHLTFDIPTAVALLLAISPWHIYLSRLGHEVNLGLFISIAAILFFILFTEQPRQKEWLYFSSFLFGLSLWTYQSQKVVMPVLALALILLHWRLFLGRWRVAVVAFIIGSLVALPAVWATATGAGLVRLQATSAFSGDHPLYAQSALRYAEVKQRGDIIGQIIYSRKFAHLRVFVTNYLSHFSPKWLFAGGAKENHKVPGMGLMYVWEAPFILWGIVALVLARAEFKRKAVVFLLLLSAPFPAAITTQAPHAMRSYTFLPAWQILGAFGIASLLAAARGRLVRVAIGLGLVVLVVGGVTTFGWRYYKVFPQTQSDSFQYALAQAIPKVLAREQSYDRIVFSNQNNLYQSYMFFLFFSRYDPARYLAKGGTESGGFAAMHAIGKFEFRPIIWGKDRLLSKTLLVGNPSDFSADASIVDTVSSLDKKIGVVLVPTL